MASGFFDPFQDDLANRRGEQAEEILAGEAGIPKLQRFRLGKFPQPLTIAARAGNRGIAAGIIRQAVRPRGEREGGDKTRDVPVPWRRQGFIEIVDVEDDLAFRGGEAAEIEQMTIAGGLDMEASCRGSREVCRHDTRGAATESKRRLRHAAKLDRNQFGHPVLVGFAQQIDRVGARGIALPDTMAFAGKFLPQGLSCLLPGIGRPCPFVRRY